MASEKFYYDMVRELMGFSERVPSLKVARLGMDKPASSRKRKPAKPGDGAKPCAHKAKKAKAAEPSKPNSSSSSSSSSSSDSDVGKAWLAYFG